MKQLRVLLVVFLALFGNVCAGEEVLMVFTASWCAPCQQFKADLKENPDMVGNREVNVFDIETAKELAKDFNVKTVPTFVLVEQEADEIKKENELRRQTGYTNARKLQRWLERR